MKNFVLLVKFSFFVTVSICLSSCENTVKEEIEVSHPIIEKEERTVEKIKLSVSILEGGIFSITGDSESLLIQKKPSAEYQGVDYEITMNGSITNIVFQLLPRSRT